MQNEFNIKKSIVMNHIGRLKEIFRIISDEVVSIGFPLCSYSQEAGVRSSLLALTWSIADQARDVLRAFQA